MAEKQSANRMDIESAVVKRDTLTSYMGLIFAFIVAMAFLGAGVYLVMQGHVWPGVTVLGVDIVALSGVFVYGANAGRMKSNQNDGAMSQAGP